eukprot:Phypoly_transcript_17877.p1 GENE.Phypoly_transcript_17877~~Phypoly_transcript_17877.p1  ORF type:complete len:156 (+),score=30.94 Phypoly_transcript_17877:219-686(+)
MAELALFESKVGDERVFVLYLPTSNLHAGEHIDRILSVLHVEIADRKGIRDSFEDFVSRQTPGHFVKFKVCVTTADKDINLRSSGGHHFDHTKILKFAEVESWGPAHMPTLVDVMKRFNLPSLTTVMHHHHLTNKPPSQNEWRDSPKFGKAVLGY